MRGKNFIRATGVFLSLYFLVSPVFVFAQSASPLVPCGTLSSGGVVSNPCGWSDFITLLNNITNYLIILGAAFSAIAFGWAGFMMMTAGGEMSKIEKAKSIFGKVLVGFIIMLSAWLIVYAIEKGLIAPSSGIQSLLTPTP